MKKVDINSVGLKIKHIRQGNGLTQDDFARLMNVSVRTVSGWETGDRPPRNGKRFLEDIKNKLEVEERLEENDETQSVTNLETEISLREKCRELQDDLIEVYKMNIKLMEVILKNKDSVETDPTNKKNVVPDKTTNKLFDLMNKLEKFTSFSIGYSGGRWDTESDEGHRWLQNQLNQKNI